MSDISCRRIGVMLLRSETKRGQPAYLTASLSIQTWIQTESRLLHDSEVHTAKENVSSGTN